MAFKKKNKELSAAEREKKILDTADKLKVQVLTMENKKSVLLDKVLEAKEKGLEQQEQQARGLLRRYLASQKRAQGMLMTLELAIQSRDLAELNHQFLECLGDLSDEISSSVKKSNAKKAEKKYLRSLYANKKQVEELDKMLEVGDYASVASIDQDKYEEFDSEIDALVAQKENYPNLKTAVNKTQKL